MANCDLIKAVPLDDRTKVDESRKTMNCLLVVPEGTLNHAK